MYRYNAFLGIFILQRTLTVLQSELSPPRIRGFLGSLQQWMIGLGVVVAVSDLSIYYTPVQLVN